MGYPNDPNQPPFGQSPYGQQPPPDQSPYGQSPYGQQPPFGQSPYGQSPPPGAYPNPYGSYPNAYGAKRRGCLTLKWVVLTIVGVMVLSCVGMGLFFTTIFGDVIETAQAEVDGAELVVSQFMQAGKANDPKAAALLAEPGFTQAEIAQLFKQRDLFAGYQSADIGLNGLQYQGNSATTTLSAGGEITYATGASGTFLVQMRKQRGAWKIQSLTIER